MVARSQAGLQRDFIRVRQIKYDVSDSMTEAKLSRQALDFSIWQLKVPQSTWDHCLTPCIICGSLTEGSADT